MKKSDGDDDDDDDGDDNNYNNNTCMTRTLYYGNVHFMTPTWNFLFHSLSIGSQ
jgi:hypothetical protein